jgi:hypothetical protein
MIDPNEFLTPLDFVIAPFVMAILYGIALRIRNRYYPIGHPWRPYFIPGLSIKFVGAILIGLIYAYYYGGGDTFNYHYHARVINSALNESVGKWFNLLLAIPEKGVGEYYEYTTQLWWYRKGSTYTTSAITAFLSAPFGSLYLPTALVFAMLSFSGVWALFRTFARLYPTLTRQVAIATLFIPSLALWGSSIFKDTISLFALGWLTYGSIQMLAYRNFRPLNVVITLISFVLAFAVKPYIVISLLPPIALWGGAVQLKRIGSPQLRTLVGILLLAFLIGAFGALLSSTSDFTERFSLDELAITSQKTRGWISYVNTLNEGSAYDLGDFDPSLTGMLTKFPLAVNVTLFRPYIWESGKVLVFFNALESLALLLLTLKVLSVVGLKQSLSTIRSNPTIQFALLFSIVFAFAVGISSFNFGALSRYKIPCIPFYALSMVLIYYLSKPGRPPLVRQFRI